MEGVLEKTRMSERSGTDLPNVEMTSKYLHGYVNRLGMMQNVSTVETT